MDLTDEKTTQASSQELGHQLVAAGDPLITQDASTDADKQDMYRMGKVQQMQRIFRLFPMFSFCVILMGTWEIALGTSTISLYNGGTAGSIYGFIIDWIGLLAVYSSMAEMGSMAPTSGGQYHWVSELAPRRFQRILSYAVGWLSVLGWQIAVTSTSFQSGTQLQGLLVLNYESYVYRRWHGTLLVIAVVSFACLFNIFAAKKLPLIEVLLFIFHVCGFIAVLVPLLVLSKKSTSEVVWTQFFDSGWGSYGTSTLVGLIANVIPMLGADAAAHMSEELQDASYTLPRAMMFSTVVNGTMGLIMIIAYCYCVGDILEVTATETGYAYLQVFYNAAGRQGATAMASVVIIVTIFTSTTILATTSRQLFAFSRDKGFPFSRLLAHVHPRFHLPVNSIIFSFLFTALLSLINIGSTVAFNIINSVGVGALMISYIICIGCLLWRKITKQELLPTKYPIGGGVFGLLTNAFALCFLTVVFIFSFFPPFPAGAGLDIVTMNWACLIFGFVVIWSIAYFLVKGRHVYEGPVAYVRKLE